jgi:catechol 2,3-dioxygenase-like lactoylglutathione lyase family enzyme
MPSKTQGIAPLFLVEDVVRAAQYYRDRLGFEIGPYFLDPPVFVIVRRDGVAIMLSLMEGARGGSNTKWKGESFDAYIWVENADAVHEQLKARHADLVGAPQLKSYGMKELDVRDADGYVIRFGEDVPGSANAGRREEA